MKEFKSELSYKHKIERSLFSVIWNVFVKPIPRSLGKVYKRTLLRMFGAQISKQAIIYSSAKVYYPKNLIMEGLSVIGPNTNIYNVDKITIKDGSVISQGVYLCAASHDISDPNNHLITAPIVLEANSWVAADAFVGMGVTIGEGAVVGARAVVVKDVAPWTVVVGNPARVIKKRIIHDINK